MTGLDLATSAGKGAFYKEATMTQVASAPPAAAASDLLQDVFGKLEVIFEVSD